MKINPQFLPVTKEEMLARGISQPDFVYVNGDAYVDHPSFGAAIISRVLEDRGYSVCMLSQPDFSSDSDFKRFGKPRLGFLVSSGNLDSMVAHYTSAKKKRNNDYYSPGGKAGKRPDRAVDVYCSLIRRAYGNIPVIIGGLEASLRRFAHYDYWSDSVRPSILETSGADILSFGPGEKSIPEIADLLNDGWNVSDIRGVKGTCYLCDTKETPYEGRECPSFTVISSNKKEYAVAARIQQDEQDPVRGKTVKQRQTSRMLVQNPPSVPLTSDELDSVFALSYTRKAHPSYDDKGGVPALNEVEFSITHNRGCFGGCNFCSITLHQGRYVTSRSRESVIEEAKLLTSLDNFKGYIHDVGGPTADFRTTSCEKQKTQGLCKDRKCLFPTPCPNLNVDHSEYLDILRSLRELPEIKKVFIRSGIRFDYVIADKNREFFNELVKFHISGQLRLAPEHCSSAVLDKMGKPRIDVYNEFVKRYSNATKAAGKEQYIVPYLMSSHPGSSINDAIELALFIKKNKLHPEQVQDFYPTPGTISTAMYYTGLDPYTLKSLYVAKSPKDKAEQRALLQYYLPENKKLVLSALKKAGRYDLIGTGASCLVSDDTIKTGTAVYGRKTEKQNFKTGKNRR